MGYAGQKATEEYFDSDNDITVRSYLDGSIIHFNFKTDGHGIQSDKKPGIIEDFLLDKKSVIPNLITPTLMGY